MTGCGAARYLRAQIRRKHFSNLITDASVDRLIYYPYRNMLGECLANILRALSYFFPQLAQQDIALILSRFYRAQLELECVRIITDASNVLREKIPLMAALC